MVTRMMMMMMMLIMMMIVMHDIDDVTGQLLQEGA